MFASCIALVVALGPSATEASASRAASREGVTGDSLVSPQVNVDPSGKNIPHDAANGPSIAVDPTDPIRMVIGWRQFDTVTSNSRKSGWACSNDGGRTWMAAGVLGKGEFSDAPVLAADMGGTFYYSVLQPNRGSGPWARYLYRSNDGGVTWLQDVYVCAGQEASIAIDRSDSVRRGHIYGLCDGRLTRSIDGGKTFLPPIELPGSPAGGTITVGIDGAVYIAVVTAGRVKLLKFLTGSTLKVIPALTTVASIPLGGEMRSNAGPNTGGVLGRIQIAVDHSARNTRGNIYLLCSVDPPGPDPLDVMFTRSTDGGATWAKPIRVNDDGEETGAWQWFGTMSVAPDGRIDVIWNDTRSSDSPRLCELYYSFSTDGGGTWSDNTAVSRAFDSWIGWPNENKIGDGYDMVSDNAGASVAYSATFNREQDVYYLRIPRGSQGRLPSVRGGDETKRNP